MSGVPVPPPRSIPIPFDRRLAQRLRALDDDTLAYAVAVLVDVSLGVEQFLETFVDLADLDVIADSCGRAELGFFVIEGGRR